MPTVIEPPLVTTPRMHRLRFLVGLQLGLGIGILAALSAVGAIYAYAEATRLVDPHMESACKWPVRSGEMTVVTVLDGKLHCWEWK